MVLLLLLKERSLSDVAWAMIARFNILFIDPGERKWKAADVTQSKKRDSFG